MTTKQQNISTYSHSQVDYAPRQEERGGRTYTVVPVVMLVEGVHHGSAGPILHLPEQFSQNAAEWNGVPLTAGHPEGPQGQAVLASEVDPDLWVVGYVDNARVEEGKLKAEAWIDQQRALAISPEILNYITEGRRLEVSTGMLSHDAPKQGQHNGEQYEAVTMEYHPDHLALLPGEQGACSWADGCGIRNNKQKEDNDEMSDQPGVKQDICNGLGVHNGLQANQTGFRELAQRIQSMLDRRDSEARVHFLTEIYDDYFVYEVRDRDQGTQKYFRQDFSFNESENDIDFEGEAAEVRKNVEFVEIQRNKQGEEDCGCSDSGLKRTKFNKNANDKEDSMSDAKTKQPSGEVMDAVVSLINNERTRFSKADREWLLQLNESQLSTLEPTEAEKPEVTREDAIQALQEDFSDVEKVKELLPEEVAEQVEVGIKAYKDQRTKLVKSIQANTGDTWPTETLESMELENLERLEKSSRITDYSGQGPIVNNNGAGGQGGEMLLPAGVKLED